MCAPSVRVPAFLWIPKATLLPYHFHYHSGLTSLSFSKCHHPRIIFFFLLIYYVLLWYLKSQRYKIWEQAEATSENLRSNHSCYGQRIWGSEMRGTQLNSGSTRARIQASKLSCYSILETFTKGPFYIRYYKISTVPTNLPFIYLIKQKLLSAIY